MRWRMGLSSIMSGTGVVEGADSSNSTRWGPADAQPCVARSGPPEPPLPTGGPFADVQLGLPDVAGAMITITRGEVALVPAGLAVDWLTSVSSVDSVANAEDAVGGPGAAFGPPSPA